MNRLDIFPTPINGLHRIVSRPMGDSRGHFSRLFCADELAAAGWTDPIAQANLTYTRQKNTVRGLHFQHPPYAELKMVRCLRGEVWDVVVDIRAGSSTFLKWYAIPLSPANLTALLIPRGCAHGFQTLTDDVEMLYLHSAIYAQDSEGGLNITDPTLSIDWPLPIGEISPRDQSFPLLSPDFKGIVLP